MGTPSTPIPEWQQRFEGREPELDRLKAVWQQVVAEGRSTVLPIVGPTGVGKTRLVQQFYAWLSTVHDAPEPEGYWPDALGVGHSLDYAPDLHECQPLNLVNRSMPFLWWGARWHDPTGRNRPAASGEGFEGAWPLLKAHAAVRLTMQEARSQRRQNTKDAVESIARAAIAAVPWAELPLAVADAGQEIAKLLRGVAAEKRLNEESLQRVQLRLTALDQEFERSVSAAFKLFLRPNNAEWPPAPAVLFLDDAHWARPSAVRLFGQLARGPIDATGRVSRGHQRWPLMVLMTYWPDHWNRHRQSQQSEPELSTARELLKSLGAGDGVRVEEPLEVDAFELDPAVGSKLRPMIQHALPGVTPTQLARIDTIVGGNARLGVELLKLLTSDQRMFVDFDVRNPLEDSQLARLEALPAGTELYRVIQARLDSLPEVREALAVATLQGPTFLTELVAEVANAMPLPPDAGDKPAIVRAGLLRAVDPEALAEKAGQATCRFPEAIYFKVCDDHLRAAPGFRDSLGRAVADRIAVWVREDRAAELPLNERVLLLGIAADTLDPNPTANAEHAEAWQDALIFILATLERTQAHADQCGERLSQLFDARPPQSHAAEWVARYGASGVAPLFRMAQRLRPSDARTIGEALLHELEYDVLPDDTQSLREIGEALFIASMAFRDSDPGQAIELCNSTVRVYRTIIERFGEDEGSLDELGVSLNNLAVSLDDASQAELHYDEALHVRRRMVQEYGSDRESLLSLCASLFNLACTVVDRDEDHALALYEEALQLLREIVARFGEERTSLQNLSLTLVATASAVRREDPERSHLLLEEALLIDREIIERYGEDRESLYGLGLSLHYLARALTERDAERSSVLHNESLQIRRVVVERYGESKTSLRNLSTSLVESAYKIRFNDPDRSIVLLSEALQKQRDIVARFGKDKQSLGKLAMTLITLADTVRHADPERALTLVEEALLIDREIIERYGEDRKALQDVSNSLRMVAFLVRPTNPERSVVLLSEALQTRRDIVAHFGEDIRSLRGLAEILSNLADTVRSTDPERAVALGEEALEIRLDILARFGEDKKSLQEVSDSQRMVASLVRTTNPERSVMHLSEALQKQRDIVARCGEDRRSLRELAEILSNLADTERRADPEHALALGEEALEIRLDILARFGEDRRSLQEVSDSQRMVASSVHPDDPGRALTLREQALEISREVLSSFGGDARALRRLSSSLIDLSFSLSDRDAQRASALLEEAMLVRRDIADRTNYEPRAVFDLVKVRVSFGILDRSRAQACFSDAADSMKTLVDLHGMRPAWVATCRYLFTRRSEWMEAAEVPTWQDWWENAVGEAELPPLEQD